MARGSVGVVLVLLLTASGAAAAQQPVGPTTLRAGILSGAIRLDGIPDEPAWFTADSLTDFRQLDPQEGAPGTRRTVVRVLAGADGLYVAAWMMDEPPEELVHAHLRRDDDIESDDYIGILLDTQHDRRSGYVFGTNPNGMLYDGEVVNTDNLNTNWNGVWDVRAHIGASGWTAEFFLPWGNFRHADGAREFGFNVARLSRRSNETVLWQSWLRQQGLLFQETEGTLELPATIPGRPVLEARPYAAATGEAETHGFDSSGAYVATSPAGASAKAGFDGKLSVTPTLTLDVTANTDFAQVEADRQVVNLTRFPLFFPEKRQFFLEAASLFDLGQPERTQLFHSRTIGLDASGNVVPIVAGARLTGRLGRERLGLLAVRTGGDEDAVDLVGRVQHDVLSRGYVGAMGTWQGGPGIDGSRLGGGLDFAFPLLLNGQNLVPQGFVAATRNAAGQPLASAWRLFLDYPNDWADNFLGVSRIESGFDPALGFVHQAGILRVTGAARFLPRPHRWGVRKLEFKPLEFDVNWNLDGSLNNAFYEVRPLGAEFENGAAFEFNLQHRDDVPVDSFEIFDGVQIAAGRYHWNRAELQFESSPSPPLVVRLGGSAGGFYDGQGEEVEYDVSLRIVPHIIAGVEGGWQWVRLPGGSFTAQVHRVRLDHAASPRLNTTLFVQWDNESNRLAVNARLHWIPRPGSDAYLVWNTAWPTALAAGIPWDRPLRGALVGKFVYYFRV